MVLMVSYVFGQPVGNGARKCKKIRKKWEMTVKRPLLFYLCIPIFYFYGSYHPLLSSFGSLKMVYIAFSSYFSELCFTRFAEDLLTYSFLRAIVCSFFSLLPCYVLLCKIARVWILLFLHWNLLFNIVMYVLENAVSA